MGHIFISYGHKDSTYAHGLADHLRNMGFDTWIDERLDYGSQWPHEIQTQLDSCDAFILIMTPRSFASDWVQSELQRAKRKRKPIFPLLLEGEEPWLSVESIQYYDVRNGKWPDDEFNADLKKAASWRESGPAISHSPTSTTKAGNRLAGIVAALGCIAAIGLCLVVGGFLFRQGTGQPLLFPLPQGADMLTAQPTSLENTMTAAVSLPVQLPDEAEVVMISPAGITFQYTILSAQREPLPSERYLLRLRIRVWTDGGLNFGTHSFRLAAGDRRLAPVNYLNEVVERDQTVDGDVEFEIDSSLKEAVLVITAGSSVEPWATKELRLIFP